MKKHLVKVILIASIIAFFATGCYVQRPGYYGYRHHHERHGGYYRY